ncbi:prenyltransferase/squalene oxidase repeat-containing protein [Streptomyces sp. NPDC005805]|uniref:prenyltransferase/squalene oxidase repeat-containing protein n=1 Tax=Streptomyces sp. NPDC005805 TaxID=3157068 RepID=UPI00341104A1
MLAALLIAVGAGLGAYGAPPAAADPIDDCTPTTGAIVAVDFGPWGGGVVRGCDTTPTTGYELLHEGGFSTAGTEHDGPAFICRIGHGSFASGTQHPTPATEACRLTPPAGAYWSYWVASPGQKDWSYSQFGAMDRKPKPGDVDAWVYGGTDVGGSTGKPDFSPDDVRAPGGTGPGPGPSPDPTVPAGEVDLAGAASWVKARLTDGERVVPEGSDTADHFSTTEAAYALAAAAPADPATARTAAFLAGQADAYAYPAGPGEAPDTNAAARLALAASVTGGDPRDADGRDLLGDLVKHLCTAGPGDGSPTPGCTARGDFHNTTHADVQSLAVLALLRGELAPPAAALARLTDSQCENGGVSNVLLRPGENCDPDPATTGLAALALDGAGGHDAAVDRARAYLRAAQRQDGAFPGWTGSPTGSVIATGYAAQALRALGETSRADAAVSWLSRQQLPDGGFGFEEGAEEGAFYPTAAAVLAGAGTSLLTLTTKQPEPTDPPTTPGPTPKPTPTPTPTKPAGKTPDLAKGVAYLTAPGHLRQGRWYGTGTGPGAQRADFGLTIDGAYALAATGLADNTLRGVVDFLDDGGKDGEGRTVHDWTGVGTGHATAGSIGKTAVLAQAVGRDPRDFGGRDLIAALGEAVCAKPSEAPDRSCAAKGAYTYAPSVFAQSLAVIAQLRAGETEAAAEPVAYLSSLQHGSGAWPSLIPATGDSDVDSTAIAAMALDLVGGERAAAAGASVDKALAWIASQQLPDGGFPGAAGNSVNSAALAVQGLSLDEERYADRIAKARAFLAAQQNADGGFNVAAAGQRGSDLRASTQAIGGSTGVSFGTLTRSLDGTTPPPTPAPTASAPVIVTPGDGDGDGSGGTTGGTGGLADGGGSGGGLASTGVQATALAAVAAALVLGGRLLTTAARRRRAAQSGGPA